MSHRTTKAPAQSTTSPDVRGSVVDGWRERVQKIKHHVCGDKIPRWRDDQRIMQSRLYIADLCDEMLSASLSPPAGAEREAVEIHHIICERMNKRFVGDFTLPKLEDVEIALQSKSPSTVPAQDDVVKFIATGEKLFAFLDAFDDGQEECETIKIETTLGAVNSWCGFIEEALRRSRPSPAPTVEVHDLTPRREAGQTINLKDLGFTLATSPEASAEIDTMKRERALASLRSRNIIFD